MLAVASFVAPVTINETIPPAVVSDVILAFPSDVTFLNAPSRDTVVSDARPEIVIELT